VIQVDSLLTLLAASLICIRLLTFRRGEARHRAGYACLAWLLIAGTGTVSIRILTGTACPSGWGIAVVMLVLAALVVRARGNVAHVIQLRRL
jgi:hypothetical protein